MMKNNALETLSLSNPKKSRKNKIAMNQEISKIILWLKLEITLDCFRKFVNAKRSQTHYISLHKKSDRHTQSNL